MFSAHSGELAAIATACAWTGAYLFFTIAVRIAGASWLNRWRLSVAVVLLVIIHWIVYRTPLPFGADLGRWGWLTLSGIVGFAISDALLFRALLHLGAHRTSLVMALVPAFSALMAWTVFGEQLTRTQLLSSGAIVAGIALVISARPAGDEPTDRKAILVGVLFALGTVVAQSMRYILSKQAMAGGGLPPLSANVVQILAGMVTLWIIAFVGKGWRQDFDVFRNRKAAFSMIGGAVVGPVIGVTLSLVALNRAPVGIASTLMALSPVLLLAFTILVLKQKVSLRAIIGTALAVGGVACLFLF